MARYYYHGWTMDEERVLTDIMTSGQIRRKKMDELFIEAAETLERTVASCTNRWYEIRRRNEDKVV